MQFLQISVQNQGQWGGSIPRFLVLLDVYRSAAFYSSSLPWYILANMFQEPQMQQSLFSLSPSFSFESTLYFL